MQEWPGLGRDLFCDIIKMAVIGSTTAQAEKQTAALGAR